MKWLLLPFCLCFSCCCFAQGQKPKIRALVAIDEVSKGIKPGDRADRYRIEKSLKGIAHQLHLSCHITTLTRESMTVERFNNWCHSIPQNSQDIVLYYYSGHGKMSPQAQSPWPLMLFISSKHPIKRGIIAGEDVYQELQAKHSRLSIILMDCCNCPSESAKLIELSPPYRPIIDGTHRLPGLQALFLKTKGRVIAAAASPGEPSKTIVGRKKNSGGFFTTGLLSAIKDYGQKKNPTWKKVFKKTVKYCRHESHGKQNPIFAIQQ